MSEQLAARGTQVARQSVFNGLQRHSGKIFKSENFWKVCEVTFVALYFHKNSYAFTKPFSVHHYCLCFFITLPSH